MDDRTTRSRDVVLGAVIVTLGGAVLDVDDTIRGQVALGCLLVLAVLIVGWMRKGG